MKKIENPQTFPEYSSGWTFSRKNTLSSIQFLFYADGDKISLVALTTVSRAQHNALFELRLKIDKMVNLATEYLNEENTYKLTVWNVICPIPFQTEFLGDFCFSIFHSCRWLKNGKIQRVKCILVHDIELIQRKNRFSSNN